jgi:hypothetical protein
MITDRQRSDNPGVAANERLTAMAGAALLVVFVVELATVSNLGTLLSVHVFVGVLMAGPLAVKLGSTGWRFVRYSTGNPAFVRHGPPPLPLRLLAPLVVASTVAVVGSGIALVVTGPASPGPFVALHVISFLVWMPAIAIHVIAHFLEVPRLIAKDWRRGAPDPVPGRRLRPGVTLGTLAAGLIAALLLSPVAAPWTAWVDAGNAPGHAYFVVGLGLAAGGLLVTRLFRWW